MMMAGRVDKATTFKVFVKNVASGTKSEELKAVFETVGRVVECLIFKETLAFVHMQDEIGGRNAILMLNAKLINGKCISVEEATHAAPPSLPTTRIRVKNVPNSLSAKSLLELFSKYGSILSVEITDDEGIVTIDAVADIRSCITDMNGYECEGQKFVVEPIVNTSITYSPKRIRPVPSPATYSYPQKYSGPPRPRSGGPPRYYRPSRPPPPSSFNHDSSYDFYPPNNYNSYSNGHGPEGRVLRDPYAARQQQAPPRPPSYSFTRPPFHHHQPCPSTPRYAVQRPTAPVTIEPLFFKRHEFTSEQSRQQSEQQTDTIINNTEFYEDDPLDNFVVHPPPQPPTQSSRPPPLMGSSSGFQEPTPLFGFQQQQQRKFAGKRSAAPPQPDPEDGEAYQVPGMIGPGEFRPPRKYFANHPNRPKRKKKKTTEPRPQPPIPDEVHKPVPDFSSYYNTQLPTGSVLRPFPPPLMDFSEDTGGLTF